MKRLWAFLTLLIAATLIVGCTQMSAKEIAKKMEEKYKAVKDMEGTMVTTIYVNGKKIVRVTKFAMKKPDKYWSDSENYTVVSNGTVMWIYDKKRNEVTIMKLPKKKPKFDYGELIEDLMNNTNVKLLGSEKVSGRDCYVIEAIPKTKTLCIKEKLWIDKEYWYPLKIESDYGKLKLTMEYKDVKFNTGISDSLFEFKPPKGAKVVEQKLFTPPKKLTLEEAQKRVNFTITVPKYTAGFKFDYAYVFKFDGREMVSLYYTKDDQKLVIAESTGYPKTPLPNATKVNINGITAEYSQVLGISILRFYKGNVSITISTKLPKDEVIDIAESMV